MDILNRDRSPVCGLLSAPNATATTNYNNNSSNTNHNNSTSNANSTTNGSSANTTPSSVTTSTTAAPRLLESSVQRILTNFSLITHGFGTPAIIAALNVVRSYLSESVKIVDRHQGLTVGSVNSLSHHGAHSIHQHHLSSHHQQSHHLHSSNNNHHSHQQQHLSNGILNDSNNTTNCGLHNQQHHNQLSQQTYHNSLVEPKKEII